MTLIEKRLVNAYAILLLAERLRLEEIPETEILLDNGEKSSVRIEAEIKKAEIEIERLS